jgi:hypothetical protein
MLGKNNEDMLLSANSNLQCNNANNEFKNHFVDLDSFNQWFRRYMRKKKPMRYQPKYTESTKQILDRCEPKLNDLYSDLRKQFGDKGFFDTDDYKGFIQLYVDNIDLKPVGEVVVLDEDIADKN